MELSSSKVIFFLIFVLTSLLLIGFFVKPRPTVNRPPIADEQWVYTAVNSPVSINLTGRDPDGDKLSFFIVTQPAHGYLNGTPPTLIYTPNRDYEGQDHFSFKVSDGEEESEPAIVNIAVSNVFYVDKNNPNATDWGPGSKTRPWRTLSKAAATLKAGQTVFIRAGKYEEELVPQNSGEPGKPIIYRSYPGEEVIIGDIDVEYAVITLAHKSYIIIEGLKVDNVPGWLRAYGSHHIIIRNNTFTRALSKGRRGGLYFIGCHDIRIVNNIIEDGNDNIMLVLSNRNIIEGNIIRKGRHTLWAIKGGNFNIIRNNYFYNEIQKIGEVFDCEVPTLDWEGNADFRQKTAVLNSTKHNLIENNIFAYTPPSPKAPYCGIQYIGQNGIIRRNLFYNCTGPGIGLQLYGTEANYNLGNRIYHNVFFKNHFGGVRLTESTQFVFRDNIFKNNILYRNDFEQHDFRYSKHWYFELNGKPVQVMTGRLDGFFFENNLIFNQFVDEPYVISYGYVHSEENPEPKPLSWWQANYPELFRGNIQADPLFVDETRYDFHLQPGSPAIDAGAFLTRTTRAGNGTLLPVADVSYFFDGFDIEGEQGDLIQLEGQRVRARVIDIDYANNILVLDRALSWEANQGVALAYEGDAPDIGAYEYGGEE